MVPLFSVAIAATQAAKPFVSPMFSDNMVLQRDKQDAVWGWTTPHQKVTVTIGKETESGTSDSDGRWQVLVGPLPAGGPYTLSVSENQQSKISQQFTNVMFGDVWICSGQSNMEFGVGNLDNAKEEIAAANYPNVRLYAVPDTISTYPLDFNNSKWNPCTPETITQGGAWNGFTAVGYFFGRDLFKDLNVPIGLIHTCWGGTVAEAWTSGGVLNSMFSEFHPALRELEAYNETKMHTDAVATWYSKNDPGLAGSGWFDPNLNDSDWKTMHVPGFFQKTGYAELNNNASVVWMRKEVFLPVDVISKDISLHFVADDNDAVWVNGTYIGATEGWNVPRDYKIPSRILKAGSNVFVVRVTDTAQPGGIYGDPDTVFLDVAGMPHVSLAGDWKVKLGFVITSRNPFPLTMMNNPNYPTVLYNGMIAPLVPFGIKGAIWYQGESNADRAWQYRRLLPAMIKSWRNSFGQGNFPFLIVQLAGYGRPMLEPGDDTWGELREAQWLTAKNCVNAGIATAIDIGQWNDIHPKNKQEVGRRLSLVAERQVYGLNVPDSGPVYKSMSIEDGKIRLRFDQADGGLVTSGGKPKGFAIAGWDHVWHWADAEIDRDSVIVSSPYVYQPEAVRYGWAGYMDVNMYNRQGLPMFPFRTDNWKLITKSG